MLKVGIIGCGGIAEYHREHFQHYTDIAKLTAFCDIIPERAKDFAKKENVDESHAYDNFKDMLKNERLDCVFICVPPYAHGEIEDWLIDRKIHFFCEKPLTLDMDLGRRISKRVKQEGIITSVGFQGRYNTVTVPAVKEFAKNNIIPFVNIGRVSRVPAAPWWKDKKLSGGQLVEMTIHQLDHLRNVLGDPEMVFSVAQRGFIPEGEIEGYDTDDLSSTIIKFECGTICTLTTGCYAKTSDCFKGNIVYSARDKRGELTPGVKFDVFGEIADEPEKESFTAIKGDGGLGAASDKAKTYADPNLYEHGLLCDRTFLEAVASGDSSKIRCDYQEGLKTVAFGLACNKSMETGLPVYYKEFLGNLD